MGAADTRVTRNTYLSRLCSFVQTCSRLLKKNEQRSSRNGMWRRGSNHSGIRRVYFTDCQLFPRTGFYETVHVSRIGRKTRLPDAWQSCEKRNVYDRKRCFSNRYVTPHLNDAFCSKFERPLDRSTFRARKFSVARFANEIFIYENSSVIGGHVDRLKVAVGLATK